MMMKLTLTELMRPPGQIQTEIISEERSGREELSLQTLLLIHFSLVTRQRM